MWISVAMPSSRAFPTVGIEVLVRFWGLLSGARKRERGYHCCDRGMIRDIGWLVVGGDESLVCEVGLSR